MDFSTVVVLALVAVVAFTLYKTFAKKEELVVEVAPVPVADPAPVVLAVVEEVKPVAKKPTVKKATTQTAKKPVAKPATAKKPAAKKPASKKAPAKK